MMNELSGKKAQVCRDICNGCTKEMGTAIGCEEFVLINNDLKIQNKD